MNLFPYIQHLREQLIVAADVGGDDARALAERLIAPLESATRLVLLDALSTAAGEISQELTPGSVDVRLRGTDPEFVVTPGTPPTAFEAAGDWPAPTAPTGDDADDGVVSRTTLRLPEQLKARVEVAAGREGVSVNTWLVRAVTAGLDGDSGRRTAPPGPGESSFTGWARS
jgi:hypothetical protein